ncbi:MAG: phosphate signaling complex protein PhoU [Desulfobacteraceae bacterium]|nr:phosphate signaling complex protein PhoU [Desulfobacteraceae bacterium]
MMRLQREIENIKKDILTLGAMVEERVENATTALFERNSTLARQVVEADNEIDLKEVEIEEECLKVIALHQPVATDLRFLASCIKINNELERIGDQTVNIGQRVMKLCSWGNPEYVFDYRVMGQRTREMLKLSLDSFVNADASLAQKVRGMDDDVDAIKNRAYDYIKQILKEADSHIGYILNMFLVSRHIERIADHATNIAEEVIYMVRGEIVRHHY